MVEGRAVGDDGHRPHDWRGLWLLGVHSSLVLGMIAGFFEFIPYAGAITSSIPAIMVAMVQSPELALWTASYIFVQHARLI